MSDNNQSNEGPGPMDEDQSEQANVDDVVEEVEEVEGEDEEEEELVEADAMYTGAVTFHPIRDDTLRTFADHKGEDDEEVAVFCVSVKETKAGLLAATGGQDDKARVWNVQTGAPVFVCTGHGESVTSCEWSQDGTYLATGDVNGVVKVWNATSWMEVDTCAESQSDTEWLDWHPKAPVLMAGFREGMVWLWQVTDGNKRFFPTCNAAATAGRILPDGQRACVGYEDGTVRVWNLKSATAEVVLKGHVAHTEEVSSLDCLKDDILTGSSDGTAKLIKNGKVTLTLRCGQGHTEDLEGDTVIVRLCPTDPLAASGTGSGTLAVWDLRSGAMRHTIKHPDGITALSWSVTRRQHVYSACQDGVLRLWDARSAQLVQAWYGHSALIQDFSVDREEKVAVTASDDGTSKVFSLPPAAT